MLGEVMIRCNNVLYLRELGEDEQKKGAGAGAGAEVKVDTEA